MGELTDVFEEKLREVKEEGDNIGRYLIGISNPPYRETEFKIGSEADAFTTLRNRRRNCIVVAERIVK